MAEIFHIESISPQPRSQDCPPVLPFREFAPPSPDLCLVSQPTEIVSIGRDEELLRLRERLLGRIGQRIVSMRPENAEIKSHSPKSRVWLFCNTVELAELLYLASSVRRYSAGSKLLLIEGVRPVRFEAALFHRVLRVTDNIDTLLKAVSQLSLIA